MQTNRSTNSLNARILPLVILGLFVSCYLLHHHLELKYGYIVGNSICNISAFFDCDSVAKSTYSEIFGIPVAIFSTAFFASILFAMYFFNSLASHYRSFLLVITFLALPFTLYMMWASVFSIGKVCLFCSFLYLLIFVLFGLIVFIGKSDGPLSIRIGEGVKSLVNIFYTSSGLSWLIASLGVCVFLFFSQHLYVDYVLKPRFLAYFDRGIIREVVENWGKSEVIFDPTEVLKIKGIISLGPKDALIQLVELSDFECPFCQKVAPIIKEIFLKHKSMMNLVLINYPLDNKCNKAIQHKMHDYSCELSEFVISESLLSSEKGYEAHERIMTDKPQSETQVALVKGDFNPSAEEKKLLDLYLQDHLQFGYKSGLKGTPDIFINGKRVEIKNYFQLESVIEQIISRVTSGSSGTSAEE